MAQASRFLFDTDFRDPRGADSRQRAAIAEAEERGRAAGYAAGRAQAESTAPLRLAQATERLAHQAEMLLAPIDVKQAQLEDEAVALAIAVARKLAGEAIDRNPVAPIAEAARSAFQHLRGVPHLAVRVNAALVEEVDAMMTRIARENGFDGRIIVLGEPDIAPGDARLEWADGGILRERRRCETALADAFLSVPANATR